MTHFTDLRPEEIGVLEKVAIHRICIDIEATANERRILRGLYLSDYIKAQPCFETDCASDSVWLSDKGKEVLASLNQFRVANKIPVVGL